MRCMRKKDQNCKGGGYFSEGNAAVEQWNDWRWQLGVSLDEQIALYLEEKQIDPTAVSYCIQDLQSGERYVWNADQDRIAASLYKLPLAMLYYEKLERGEWREGDALVCLEEHLENNPGEVSRYAIGSKVSIKQLLHDVIVYSDNTAGHILYEHLGGWQTFKQQAAVYSDTALNEAFFSYENVLSASYLCDALAYLYAHEDTFARLITDMEEATPDAYLALYVDAPIAQKWGYYEPAMNTAGIVYAARPYSIAVLTTLGEAGEAAIAAVNAICYMYFNGKPAS